MKQTILSAKQSELLENLLVKYGQIVTFGQIRTEVATTRDYAQTKKLVSTLVANGWLVRIKRGVYAISDLSTRGFLSLSPLKIANLLTPDSYVSFEAALQQQGMFDQLVGKTISISLIQHPLVNLAGQEYRFIKTQPKYYFGFQEIRVDNTTARVATPEKALVDMVNFHRSQYALDLVIEKLAEYNDNLHLPELTQIILRFPVGIIKTFGLIFDWISLDSQPLLARVKHGSVHWMLPGANRFNAKWRLYYPPDLDHYHTYP